MKIKELIVVLTMSTILFTGCSSSTPEEDANSYCECRQELKDINIDDDHDDWEDKYQECKALNRELQNKWSVNNGGASEEHQKAFDEAHSACLKALKKK